MCDSDPLMHAYATLAQSDLDRLIARGHGDPAWSNTMMNFALRTAGCPAAERNALTKPTGGASPIFAPVGAEAPFAQLRHPGRAVLLKRRRQDAMIFLGGKSNLPSRRPGRLGGRPSIPVWCNLPLRL